MEIKKRIAIYPGSFDPITNGHINIIKKGLKIFDKLIILVAINKKKRSLFDIKTKLLMIKEATKKIKNIEIKFTKGFVVDFAKKNKITTIIRGLRTIDDYNYEVNLNAINKFINNNIETIFFMADKNDYFISSSAIKELYNDNVNIEQLVPTNVLEKLKKMNNIRNKKNNSKYTPHYK